MVRGVRLSQKELMRQYPLGRRGALRVVSLLRYNLSFSPIVLEEANEGSAFEELILSSELKKSAKKGEWEKVEDFLVERDFGEDLVLVKDGDERVIALEEEVLAQEAEEELGLAPVEEESNLPILDQSGPDLQLSRVEADQIFSPEKLSELKLELLTSSQPSLRIESLRKIAFSQIAPGEKEKLFLSSLYDKNAEVRGEALQAMKSLGLNRELIDPLTQLVGEDSKEVQQGGRALLRVVKDLDGDFSKIAVVACCLRALELFDEVHIRLMVFEILHQMAPQFPLQSGSLLNIIKSLLNHYDKENRSLLEKIREVVVAFSLNDPGVCLPYLEGEIESHPPGDKRRLLLRIALDLSPSQIGQKYKKILLDEELKAYLQQRTSLYLFEDFLENHFHETLDFLWLRLGEEETAIQLKVLDLLENLYLRGEPSSADWERLFEEIIETLSYSPTSIVSWAMNSQVLNPSRMAHEMREKFARELLYHLGEGQFAEFRNTVLDLVRSLGRPALKPLLQFIRDRAVSETIRREAIEALGRLLLSFSDEEEIFRESLHSLLEIYREDAPAPKGALARTLGQAAGSDLATSEDVKKIFHTFMGEVGIADHSIEIFEGLSYLAGAPHLDEEDQGMLTRMFLQILGRGAPHKTAKVKLQAGEVVFEEDIHGRLHTDLMPYLLEGLKNLCLRQEGREKVLIEKTLLVKWRRVSSFEEVWSPFNTKRLMQSLERIASSSETPQEMSIEIVNEFLKFFQDREDSVVMSSLSEIFWANPDLESLKKEALTFGKEILERVKEIDLHQETEVVLPVIYMALARLMARGYFEGEKHLSLRDSIAQLLLRGLRESSQGAREAIQFLVRHTDEEDLRQRLVQHL